MWNRTRAISICVVGLALVGAAPSGCASRAEHLGTTADRIQITGFAGDPTFGYQQSETSTSVQTPSCSPTPCTPPPPIVDVTYNDLTGENLLVQYPPGDRQIFAGASQMGYSFSTDGGVTFHYQPVPKLIPPNSGQVSGWDVLWGDPAITFSRTDQHYVYIQNLAVSHASFPSTDQIDTRSGLPGLGYIEGSIEWDDNAGNCPANQECSYIDGGCVARSVDMGVHFQPVTAQDCFSHAGHFYDGGSMESDLSGGVYSAFNDVTANTIDVWHAPTLVAPFALMPTPFVGKSIVSHPRLRFDPSTHRLYVVALAQPLVQLADGRISGSLYIDYWDPRLNGGVGAWHGPVFLNSTTLDYPSIPRGIVDGQPANVRAGAQFGFDVGTASVNGNDEIRIAFASEASSPGQAKLFVDICTRALTCTNAGTAWSTLSYAGEQYNPVVVAQPGFIGVPAVWKVSYNSTEFDLSPGSTIAFVHTTLGVNSNGQLIQWIDHPLVQNMNLCPDTRIDPETGQIAGYWGDYDDLRILSVSARGLTTFIRTHADSSNGTCTRDTYNSSPINVSAQTCN